MKLENSQQIFGKYSNIKFHENMFGGRRAMTKQIDNFAKALKKCQKKSDTLA